MAKPREIAFAIAAHPDDIEFMMAGTLLLLRAADYEIHYMNIANGTCGTAKLTPDEIVEIRIKEAQSACRLMGATWHPSFVNDIEVYYQKELLAKVAAVVRQVNPGILLVPSPQDYMEDHANASRLAVSAAFCKGMRNFFTSPPTDPVAGDVTVYHGLPYGLHDGLRRKVFAGLYIDITSVMDFKREVLSQHQSQKEWLDYSQGLDAYLDTMEKMAAEVGRMSGRFKYAEGWRRHTHLGFSAEEIDPLAEVLRCKVVIDRDYERRLEMPA